MALEQVRDLSFRLREKSERKRLHGYGRPARCGANGGSDRREARASSMCRRCASTDVFVKLVEAFLHYRLRPTNIRGHRPIVKTSVFQTDDVGAIPAVRSDAFSREVARIISRADSPARIVVCNTTCEGSTPSR